MSELIAVIVGSVFTLVGGVGGVWLTSWLDERRANRVSERERRAEQRDHVVELVDAGREWANSAELVAVALASSMSIEDLLELDHWKANQAFTNRYRRALRAADLMLIDPLVKASARQLAKHHAGLADVMTPFAMRKLRASRPTQAEVDALRAFRAEHDQLLDEFVDVASTQLLR